MKLTTNEIGILCDFKMFFRDTLNRRVLNCIIFNKWLSGGYIDPYNLVFYVNGVLFHRVSSVVTSFNKRYTV